MPKKNIDYQKLILGVVAVVVLVSVLSFLEGFFSPIDSCVEGERVLSFCSGVREVSNKSCVGGRWVSEVRETCGSLEGCSYGMCSGVFCVEGEVLSRCSSDYSLLSQRCVGGVFVNSLEVCGSGLFCLDGACVYRPALCGDGVCTGGETVSNCPRDCGGLGSWESYYRSVASSDMEDFLFCGGDVDCDSDAIDAAVKMIEVEYNPATPYEWIQATTEWTHKWISYRREGSKGLSASDLVELRQLQGYVTGNCAQFSLLELAILRHKGIAGVQVAGCVSHSGTACSMYSALNLDFGVGYLNGVTSVSSSDYQPLAHSYLKVWTGEAWVIVDPTVKQTTAQCIGYLDVDTGGLPDKPFQYSIVNYPALEECKAF